MLAFLARALGLVCLAVAVVGAVLDLTRSVAASAPVATPLGESWLAVSPGTRALAEASVREGVAPFVWDGPVTWALALPTWVVFGALAALLLWLGRSRGRDLGRFARD